MTINPNPNTVSYAALRSAFGPGFQFGGASDFALRVITRPPTR